MSSVSGYVEKLQIAKQIKNLYLQGYDCTEIAGILRYIRVFSPTTNDPYKADNIRTIVRALAERDPTWPKNRPVA